MKTSTRKASLEALISGVATELSVDGFSRSGDCFNRTLDEVIHFIDFQSSRHNIDKFTINIGILSSNVFQFWAEGSMGARDVWASQILRRLGELLPIPQDIWWSLKPARSMAELTMTVIGLIEAAAIPFLNGLRSNADIKRYLIKRREEGVASYEELINICVLEANGGTLKGYEHALHCVEFAYKEMGGAEIGGAKFEDIRALRSKLMQSS